jgi:small GTP-binding protein
MSNKEKKDVIPCKVIVVGDSGVGKTSIINRYLEKFNPEERAKIGATFSSRLITVDNYNISLDIWDTAGEERYRSVNSIFYKEASICLIVYDITSKNTFNSIKDYWYNSVKENAIQDIILGIAGNKMDLVNKEVVDENEVKDFCKEINALYFLTSAKENSFIDNIFEEFGKKFVESDIFKNLIKNKDKGGKKMELNGKHKKKCC